MFLIYFLERKKGDGETDRNINEREMRKKLMHACPLLGIEPHTLAYALTCIEQWPIGDGSVLNH